MKKLLIISLIAASAIAGAATLNTEQKVEITKIQIPTQQTQIAKSSVLATWD